MPHSANRNPGCLQKGASRIIYVVGEMEYWSIAMTSQKRKPLNIIKFDTFPINPMLKFQHDLLEQGVFFNTPLLQHSNTPACFG
jgi:hypothetical protein